MTNYFVAKAATASSKTECRSRESKQTVNEQPSVFNITFRHGVSARSDVEDQTLALVVSSWLGMSRIPNSSFFIIGRRIVVLQSAEIQFRRWGSSNSYEE